MRKRKRTGWYPPEVKPVRVGWYERYWCGLKTLYWWDGVCWRYEPESERSHYQHLPWRGLTAPVGDGKRRNA